MEHPRANSITPPQSPINENNIEDYQNIIRRLIFDFSNIIQTPYIEVEEANNGTEDENYYSDSSDF